jgi:dienelactone hydrolase
MRASGASFALSTVFAMAACSPPAQEAPPPTTAPAGPSVKTEEVEYASGDTTMKGYLAWDENRTGERPGILVVHEWWGHNEYARSRARQLAELGYTALAVDMYGDGQQADHPDDAGAFATAVMQDIPAAQARFEAAHALLDAHPTTDASRTGAIGYCFGGGVVLHMARVGADLQAVASFHGSLGSMHTPEPGSIRPKILVAHGTADTFVAAEQIEAFKKEMDAAGADYSFVAYEGAMHSFTNPDADAFAEKFDMPLKYDAEADRQSWQAMQDLFDEAFSAAAAAEPEAAAEEPAEY